MAVYKIKSSGPIHSSEDTLHPERSLAQILAQDAPEYHEDEAAAQKYLDDLKVEAEEVKRLAPKTPIEEELQQELPKEVYDPIAEATIRREAINKRRTKGYVEDTFKNVSNKIFDNIDIDIDKIISPEEREYRNNLSFYDSPMNAALKTGMLLTDFGIGIANFAINDIQNIAKLAHAGQFGFIKSMGDDITDEEHAEANYLEAFIAEAKRPVFEKKLSETEDKIEKTKTEIQSKYGSDIAIFSELGRTNDAMYNTAFGAFFPEARDDSEESMIRDTLYNLEQAKEKIEAGISSGKTDTFKSVFEDRLVALSVGKMQRLVANIERISKKTDNNEELTPAEVAYIESYKELDKLKKENPNQNYWYQAMKGLRGSGEYVGEHLVAELALKRAKLASSFGRTLASPLLMPNTYNKANETLSGNLEVVDKYDEDGDAAGKYGLVSDASKKFYKTELESAKSTAELESERLRNKEEKTPEEGKSLIRLGKNIEKIDSELKELYTKKGEIRNKEVSKTDAYTNAYSEGLNENIAEKAGVLIGKGLGKASSGAEKVLRKSPWVSKQMDKVGKVASASTRYVDRNLDKTAPGRFAKAIYKGGGDEGLIQGVPVEMLEEGFVNLLPTYGETSEEFAGRFSENFSPKFWGDVALQTLLMKGGFNIAGATANNVAERSMMNKLTPDEKRDYLSYKAQERASRARMYTALTHIDNEKTDSGVAKRIVMSMDNAVFSEAEYLTHINDLRNPAKNTTGEDQKDRDRQANILEEKAMINTAIHASRLGTGNGYKQSMARLTRNQNVSAETRLNAQKAIDFIDSVTDSQRKNSKLVNGTHITNLQSRYKLMENTNKHLETLLATNEQKVLDVLEEFNKANPELDNVTILDLNNLLTGSIVAKESEMDGLHGHVLKFHREFLQNEQEIEEVETDERVEEAKEALRKSRVELGLEKEEDESETKNVEEDKVKNTKKRKIQDWIDTKIAINNNKIAAKKVNDEVEYELDPANLAVIRKRELKKLQNKVETQVTFENIAERKKRLLESEGNTPTIIANMNTQAVASTDLLYNGKTQEELEFDRVKKEELDKLNAKRQDLKRQINNKRRYSKRKADLKKSRKESLEKLRALKEVAEESKKDVAVKQHEATVEKHKKFVEESIEKIKKLLKNNTIDTEEDAIAVLEIIFDIKKTILGSNAMSEESLGKLAKLEDIAQRKFGLTLAGPKLGSTYKIKSAAASAITVDTFEIAESNPKERDGALRVEKENEANIPIRPQDKPGLLTIISGVVKPQINKNGSRYRKGKYNVTQGVTKEEADSLKEAAKAVDNIYDDYRDTVAREDALRELEKQLAEVEEESEAIEEIPYIPDADVDLSDEQRANLERQLTEDGKPLGFNDLSDEANANLANTPGFGNPIMAEEESPGDKSDPVAELAEDFKSILSRNPTVTFPGLVATLTDEVGFVNVKVNFNLIAKAWSLATGKSMSSNEIIKIYSTFFGKIEGEKLNAVRTVNTPTVVAATSLVQIDAPVVTVDPVTDTKVVRHYGWKYVMAALKLAFLGRNFVKRTDEHGATDLSDADSEVNTSALPFVDWRNFKPGDEVELTLNLEYLLDPENEVTLWTEVDSPTPKTKRVTVEELLEKFFPNKTYSEIQNLIETKNTDELFQNEEFLKYVPIGIVNGGKYNIEQKILPNGMNNYYWFNTQNIGLIDDDPIQQKKLIDDNRKLNLATRRLLVDGKKNVKVKVSTRSHGPNNILNTVGADGKTIFQSIADAFRKKEDSDDTTHRKGIQSVSAIGVVKDGRVQGEKGKSLKVNGKEVNTDSIINWENFLKAVENAESENGTVEFSGNGKEVAKGAVVYLVEHGIDSNGKPTYILHQALNMHEEKAKPKGDFNIQYDIKSKLAFYHRLLHNKLTEADKSWAKKNNVDLGAELKTANTIRERILLRFRGMDIKIKSILDEITGVYPEILKGYDKEFKGAKFKQDYNLKLAGKKFANGGVPKLLGFKSVDEFIETFTNGEIESITYTDILYSNLHTNHVYTPVTNVSGETVWTNQVQPVITLTTPAEVVMKVKSEDKTEEDKKKKIRKEIDDLKAETESSQVIAAKTYKDSIKAAANSNKELADKLYEDYKNQIKELNGLFARISKLVQSLGDTSSNTTVVPVNPQTNSDSKGNEESGDEKGKEVPEEIEKEFGIADIQQVVEHIVFNAYSSLNLNDTVTKKIIKDEIEKQFDSLVARFEKEGKKAELAFILKNKDAILGNNGKYDGSVMETVDLTLKLDSDADISAKDLVAQNEKDHSKEAYERPLSLSLKVKLLLSGVKDTRGGVYSNGFGGLEPVLSLFDVVASLQMVMADTNTNNNTLESIRESIRVRQLLNPKEFGFYTEIMERLDAANSKDSKLINEMMYSLWQPENKMVFMYYKKNSDGTYSVELKDANSKNPLFVTRSKWEETFKTSPLVDNYGDGQFKLNKVGLALYKKHRKDYYDTVDNKDAAATTKIESLKTLLGFVGIKLSEKLLEDAFDPSSANYDKYNQLLNNDKGVLNNIHNNINRLIQLDSLHDPDILKQLNGEKYKKLVHDIFDKKRVMSTENIADEIAKNDLGVPKPKSIKQVELNYGDTGLTGPEHKSFSLLTFDNSVINDLINVNNKLTFMPSNMMYMASKMVNIYTLPNNISGSIKELKAGGNLLDNLSKAQISKSNFLINLLKEDEEVRKYLDFRSVGLEAIKKQGAKSRDDSGVTELSPKDSIVTLINLFAHSKGGLENERLNYQGFKLRKGSIAFPTIADSSQLPILDTILIDVQESNLDGDNLGSQMMEVMINQVIKGDLLRTGAFLAAGGKTNIKGAKAGNLFIAGMSSLNGVAVDFEYENSKGETIKTKRTLIEKFRNNPKYHSESGVSEFIEEHREVIEAEINRNIKYEVDKYINDTGTKGIFISDDIYAKGIIKHIDSKYLDTKVGTKGLRRARLVAFDYVINNFIQLKEIHDAFAGDVADYFSDKMVQDMVYGRSVTTKEDIIDAFYPSQKSEILKLEDDIAVMDESEAEIAIENLLTVYPKLKYSNEYIDFDKDFEEQYREVIIPDTQRKIALMFMDVSNTLSKRLKAQVSPGNQLANSRGNKVYKQIMVQDVENSSEVLEHLLFLNYQNVLAKDTTKTLKVLADLGEFKTLDNIYPNNRTEEQRARHKHLYSYFSKEYPRIKGFLKTASTDAQEYVSWKDNLNQLLDSGRITNEQYKTLNDKFTRQEADLDSKDGVIKEENKLTEEENRLAHFQTSKPLYSGLHFEDYGDYKASRFIFIKSSSFPITPELAQAFPNLNKLRKVINKLQDENVTVRISYDSANKVGAVSKAISMEELYKDEVDMDKLESSTVTLDRKNFYIQQDKPYEGYDYADKNKDQQKSLATQFEKMLLGDGINKITDKIFPNEFDAEILKEAGITPKNGNISGVDLDTLYKFLYEKHQEANKRRLFEELNIKSYDDFAKKDWRTAEKLVKIFNKKLANKQDKKFMELLYTVKESSYDILDSDGNVEKTINITGKKFSAREVELLRLTKNTAEFIMPLHLTPNSNKFESVFGSLINGNSINLKLPGGSSPVASQQNFDFKGYDKYNLEELKRKGLITTKNFDPKKGLQATTKLDSNMEQIVDADGKPVIQYAQVFIPNRIRVTNPKTGKKELINLQDYVDENGQIDSTRLSPELLSFFSFRIPTSSHQSGVMIEVVGFLPETMRDLMIVPKDHTVQIGEDYDIDIRYFYNYYLHQNEDGSLKKLEYIDIPDFEKELDTLRRTYEFSKSSLLNEFWEENLDSKVVLTKYQRLKPGIWENNKETLLDISILEESLKDTSLEFFDLSFGGEDKELISREGVQALIEEYRNELVSVESSPAEAKAIMREFDDVILKLQDAYRKDKNNIKTAYESYGFGKTAQKNKDKVLENNIISMYKSVFSSVDDRVQNLINSTLNTDFAEETVKFMDSKLLDPTKTIFNIFSANTQAKIMNAGSDGKLGIAIHSGYVAMNSVLQQFATINEKNESDIRLYYFSKAGDRHYYNINLGTMTFDGYLGRIFSNTGHRISVSGMESQNSAADNQKLGIMSRRNEGPDTMNVFALMQAVGLDNDNTLVEGKSLSYASVFLNQPILREYAELMQIEKSLVTDKQAYSDVKETVYYKLEKKYIDKLPSDWVKTYINASGIVEKSIDWKRLDMIIGPTLTTQKLVDGLKNVEYDVAAQMAVLNAFRSIDIASVEYTKLQRFVNIENGGVGKSFFDTMDMMDELLNIFEGDIHISGAAKMIGDLTEVKTSEEVQHLINDGYVFLKEEISSGEKTYILIKPSTHYGHKIVNSIANAYNLGKVIFPYESGAIETQIKAILGGRNLNSKKKDELRYRIIREMKEYSYSSAKGLFGENTKDLHKNIFFDTEGNTSLAKYMLQLGNTSTYNSLFSLPFFKDLQFGIGNENYPSLLKYNVNTVDEVSIANVYNTLNMLANSDKELLPRNGKRYTESDLVLDLLKYSLLADQGNGAIGFRHLLPVELFTKYDIDKTIRDKASVKDSLIQSMHYEGYIRTMENMLGSILPGGGPIINVNNANIDLIRDFVSRINYEINIHSNTKDIEYVTSNNNGDVTFIGGKINMSGTFERQYFQHNPEDVRKNYHVDNIEQSLYMSGYKIEDFNNGYVVSLELHKEKNNFVTITDKSGKIRLYEKSGLGNIYVQIPTLGVLGFNEYNAGRKIQSSLVANNNPTTMRIKRNMPVLGSYKLTTDLELNRLVNESEKYKDLFRLLSPHVDFSKVKIVIKKIPGNAEYSPDDSTISINPSFYNDGKADSEKLEKVIVEELLHHITYSTMKQYVTFDTIPIDKNGKLQYTIAEGTPSSLRTLLVVYQQGIDTIVKEQGLDTVIANMKKFAGIAQTATPNSLSLQSENELDIYRISNVHEFLAGLFIKDSEFAKKMGQTKYLNSDKSILDKFVEILGKLFDSILPGAKKDSISVAGLQSLTEFLMGESIVEDSITYDSLFSSESDNKALQDALDLLNNHRSENAFGNPKEFKVVSGDAKGSNTEWISIGKEFGILDNNVSILDVDRYLNLPDNTKAWVEDKYDEILKKLNRKKVPADTEAGVNIRASIMQGIKGKSTYAIGNILLPEETALNGDVLVKADKGKEYKGSRYFTRASIPTVDGGTAYAVAAAMLAKNEIYVYHQGDMSDNRSSVGWYKYDYKTGKFEPVSTPRLNKESAVIGTREINSNGKVAIKDVFEVTFGKLKKANENANGKGDNTDGDIPLTRTYTLKNQTQELDVKTGIVYQVLKSGKKKEINNSIANLALVAYGMEENLPTKEFNKSTYIRVFGKIINIKTGSTVAQKQIADLFETEDVELVSKWTMNQIRAEMLKNNFAPIAQKTLDTFTENNEVVYLDENKKPCTIKEVGNIWKLI